MFLNEILKIMFDLAEWMCSRQLEPLFSSLSAQPSCHSSFLTGLFFIHWWDIYYTMLVSFMPVVKSQCPVRMLLLSCYLVAGFTYISSYVKSFEILLLHFIDGERGKYNLSNMLKCHLRMIPVYLQKLLNNPCILPM